MGWGSIQSNTPSAALAPSSSAGQGPQPTALSGHEAKAAPPDGFRQAIARGFERLGRRLSCAVSALPGCGRRDEARVAERTTRTQLLALIDHLESGDFTAGSVGNELARLAHEKRNWMQKDPAHAEQRFGEMVRKVVDQRWPGKKVLQLEKVVGLIVSEALAHLPEADLREQLVGLVKGRADDYRGVEALRAQHRNEIDKLGFDKAKKIADGIFWKGPLLCAALKAFDRATQDCGYQHGASEADLQAARDALEEAGNTLLEALDATHPKRAGPALTARHVAGSNWRALFVRPKNQAQANLYSQLTDGYALGTRPKMAAVRQKSTQAKALLTQVRQDAQQRQRGVPRSSEGQYFRELRKGRRYLERVSAMGASDDDPNMHDLKTALQRLPTSTVGAGNRSAGQTPDYTQALETLHEALAAADRKVAGLVTNTVEQITQLEKEPRTPGRAEKAQQLIKDTNDAVLMKLPMQDQLSLLKLLRADRTQQPPRSDVASQPFLVAQAKLYSAMKLDAKFLAHEKSVRGHAMIELQKDKKMLQDARDLWHTYTPNQRRQVMMKVAAAHSRALGCEPPLDIVFSADPARNGYAWKHRERVVEVGTSTRHHMDFEDMMEGVFHENSHNWQDQLLAGFRKQDPETAKRNPLYPQALMFASNMSFYSGGEDYLAYRQQPVEAHAFRAGRKFGADLMRMLAS
jgi:hypothetical protein